MELGWRDSQGPDQMEKTQFTLRNLKLVPLEAFPRTLVTYMQIYINQLPIHYVLKDFLGKHCEYLLLQVQGKRTSFVKKVDYRMLLFELYITEIYTLKSQPPVPQNVIVFGDMAFKEVIDLK